MPARSRLFWPLSIAVVAAMASPVLPSCGSKSSGAGFGDDASSSSGGGSSSGTSSGSSDDGGTGSSSSSTSGSTSGSSSGSSSGTSSGVKDAGYVVETCGKPCDLRQNTCCIPADGGAAAAYCPSGTTVSCGMNVATFHCVGVDDCAKGQICCGDYDLVALTATTACQTKSCALAQFCRTSAECPSGVQCIAQTCTGGANVHLCGLKSGPPYNCVAQ